MNERVAEAIGEGELADAIQEGIEALRDDSTATKRLEEIIGLDGPDDDDEGPVGGVREPRRPLPGSDSGSGMQLTADFGEEAAP